MRELTAIAWIALSAMLSANSHSGEMRKPDAQGYIRDWLMLAPIIIPEGRTGTDSILEDQIKNESGLRPKAGDKVTINRKELAWTPITASTNYFDFNLILKGVHDRAMGYMVTYIECEQEMPDVTMALASNDQGRLYFNGVDIYFFGEPRTLELDADKGNVTLKKGVNSVVFKVFNEQGNWQGAMRFLDKTGAPLTNLKIKLTP